MFSPDSFINNYQVIKQIGKGGSSKVYLVRSMKYSTLFVAKVTNNIASTKATSQFLNEVETLKKLDHPNIIRIYECFEFQGFVVLILEYCPGGTLADTVQREALSESQFCSIARQLLSALHYMHSQQIAHRDIKPQNIYFDETGRVKFADFGISQYCETSSTSVNAATPSFAAPEVLYSRKKHNPFLADIYSLGATFFYMIERCIYDGRGIIWTRAGFNRNLFRIVNQMLSTNPANRPTIEELMEKSFFKQIRPQVSLSSYKTLFKIPDPEMSLPQLPHAYQMKRVSIIRPKLRKTTSLNRSCLLYQQSNLFI